MRVVLSAPILGVPCVLLSGASVLRSDEIAKLPPIPRKFLDAQKDPKAGFPLEPGYRWSYVTKGRYSMFLETTGGSDSKETPSTTLVARRGSMFWSDALLLSLQDGVLYCHGFGLRPLATPVLLLPAGLDEGLAWTVDVGVTFRAAVTARERVTVPAGEFDAWKIEYVRPDDSETGGYLHVWFTPGIGFVQVERNKEVDPLDENPRAAKPIVQQLERIEDVRTAHPIDYPSKPQPITRLPKSVRAAANQLTLFADYADRWDGGVVLYLVNRSPEGVLIPGEDGEPFVRLDSRTADGRWERSERHFYSFCGNTGPGPFLEPETFMAILGYLPEKGEEREVRYRLHGEQALVSNVGRGKVDPAEVLEARYDEMAFREGGVQLLEEALFKAGDLPADLKARARDNSLEHMVFVPLVQDYPLLDRLFEEMERTGSWDDRIFEVLAHHSTRRALDYVMGALKSGPPAKRRYALRNLSSDRLPIPFDREIFDLLLEQVKDPKLPGLPGAIAYLGESQRADVKPVLEQVEESASYPAAARAEAAYQLAYQFTPGPLDVQVNYTDIPGTITVTLTNEGDRPLSFAYREPREIVRVFLKLDGEYMAPRDSVAWFSRAKAPPANARLQRVVLERGEQHSLNLNVLDYFDAAEALKSSQNVLSVSATARVPGSGKPRAARGWTVISSGEP